MTTDSRPVEIICSACGQETILRRKPRYEGFTRVGEELSCAACGHVFTGEAEVPFKRRQKPAVFDASDRPASVKIPSLHEQEHRFCRYCAHYVVNPFIQRCALRHKEVEATDTCDRFEAKPPPKQEAQATG